MSTDTAETTEVVETTNLELDVRTADGKTDGTVTLPAEIFDVQVNIPLIHQVVVAQLAAARQGTHSTKNRGEVRGGGAQALPPEGHRPGPSGLDSRAPQFAGGGVVHGPTPRSYAQRTPKKMKAAALRGALSDRARNGRVHVVAGLFEGDVPSTRTAIAVLAGLSERKHVLVVAQRGDELTWKSLRNAERVHLLVRRPAQHLRRAGLRRRGVHPRRPRRVPGRPGQGPLGQGAAPPRPRPQTGDERLMSSIHKDHRDVLLAPVVSREELRPPRREQVHVPGPPRRQQDRDQDRGRAGLRRQGHRCEHAQP